MGHGKWTDADYTNYATRTAGSVENFTRSSTRETFRQSRIHESLDPKKFMYRESVASADNPDPTPVMMALDVTGSMGDYANMIATQELPRLMRRLIESKPITDPHLMFLGIDDVRAARSDEALQVSQFEADVRIIEQLGLMCIVGQGGGNRTESYDLAWDFAAFRTRISSIEKGKKGFLFTMGDEEAPYEILNRSHYARVYGSKMNPEQPTLSPKDLLEEAKKKYHCFHLVIEQGSYYSSNPYAVKETWTALMGPNVLFLKDFKSITEVVCAVMAVVNGEDLDAVIESSDDAEALRHAFQNAYSSEG